MEKLLKITGTVVLYGGASLFLASLLLAAYLNYAWKIDKVKRLRLLAVAQGHDLAELQRRIEDRVAEMSYDEVLQLRAKRLRKEEFQKETSERSVTELLLADERKIDGKLKQIQTQRDSFDQYVKNYLERTKSAGLAEETRLIEEAEPEFAKDIILGIIKDRGDTQRVLTMLLAMEERNRGEILYAMQEEAELKVLVDLLQRIGNGEPLSKIIEEAAALNQEK